MSDAVYLVDAMAYIFRAYYGQDPLRGPAGQPVHASFGYMDFLIRLIAREQPAYLAAVFDSGPKSFRNEIYEAYKANREAAPEDLLPQFAQCERLSAALGLTVFKVDNHEADDVLASLAAMGRAAGRRIVIISGDKDLAQLVDDRVSVLDPSRQRRYTPRTVRSRFGVEPAQIPDWLALTGDASDNVPGVRGVGPKTATALLTELADLDAIYADLARVAALPLRGAAGLARRLAEHREAAYLSRELVTLRRDLPVAASLDDLAYRGASRADCEALFAELGFQRALAAVPRWS